MSSNNIQLHSISFLLFTHSLYDIIFNNCIRYFYNVYDKDIRKQQIKDKTWHFEVTSYGYVFWEFCDAIPAVKNDSGSDFKSCGVPYSTT